jgi:FtsP/CotA-like multicopper oxidase with cupredoxin domain
MKRRLLALLLVPALIAGSLAPRAAAAPQSAQQHGQSSAQPITRRITLVAEPGRLSIRPGQTIGVWTYNGSVPGPEIVVHQGDRLVVTLVNNLPAATTIHWHGLIASNSVDGVPGVTQDAVLPGHTFTYGFVASTPGTYWYHPHQQSNVQVAKGLYGALIVLPRQTASRPALDRTLLLGEWALPAPRGQAMAGLGGDQATMPLGGQAPFGPYLADTGMGDYQTFIVNGKAYPSTTPILGPAGSLVRLRLINAGNLTHILQLQGVPYRLVATDGSQVNSPSLTTALLPIAAGQRLDITFTMPRGTASLADVSGLPGATEMRVLIGQGGRSGQPTSMGGGSPTTAPSALLDLARYGQPARAPFSMASRFDRVFRMVIGQKGTAAMDGMAGMGGMKVTCTLNGAAFPHTAPLPVRTGQRVELVFVSKSKDAHPMHLHGQRFQVLVLNGERVTGAPLFLDMVMVLPHRTTVVAFVAANRGIWAVHCHELHHAAAGLVSLVRYQGVAQRFVPGGPAGNIPE